MGKKKKAQKGKKAKKRKLPESFPMSGGDGTHSYARNSTLQKSTIDGSKERTGEAISTNIDLRNPHFGFNVFKIADFGCSVGPNTFEVIQHIINTLKHKFEQENKAETLEKDIEFHVFFNDQTKNDFNTLFKNLPSNAKYFVAGVPGSFYNQLFPRNSLHIGHTSNTLHWLSRAPEGVSRLNSKPYRTQFQKDMKVFLDARAKEIVPGGLMIILGQCCKDGSRFDQTFKGFLFGTFVSCLADMTNDSEQKCKEKSDPYNLPLYFPYFSELKKEIEQSGCFSIELMEDMKRNAEAVPVTPSNDVLISSCQALFHESLVERFGEDWVKKLFDRFAKKFNQHPLDFSKFDKDMQYVAVLKRN